MFTVPCLLLFLPVDCLSVVVVAIVDFCCLLSDFLLFCLLTVIAVVVHLLLCVHCVVFIVISTH